MVCIQIIIWNSRRAFSFLHFLKLTIHKFNFLFQLGKSEYYNLKIALTYKIVIRREVFNVSEYKFLFRFSQN